MKPGDLVTYSWMGTVRNSGLILDSWNGWIRILWDINVVQEFQIMDPDGWEVIREGW